MANVGDQLAAILQQLQVQGPSGAQLKHFRGELWENYLEWFRELEPGQRALTTDQLKVQRFRNHLKDAALDFFNDLPEETQTNWQLLKLSFAERFVTDHIHAAYAGALRNRKQQPTESVAQLLTDIKRLVKTVHMSMPEEHREDVVRDAFLMALREDIAAHVEMHLKSLSLTDVYKCASKYESVIGLRGGVDGSARQGMNYGGQGAGVFLGFRCNSSGERSASVNALARHSSAFRGRVQSQPSSGRGRYQLQFLEDGTPVCARCGEAGHFRRDCRQNYQRGRSLQPYRSRAVHQPSREAVQRPQISRSRLQHHGSQQSSRGNQLSARRFHRGRGGTYRARGGPRVNYAGLQESEEALEERLEENAPEASDVAALRDRVKGLEELNRRFQEREEKRSINLLSQGRPRLTGLSLGATVILTVCVALLGLTEVAAQVNKNDKLMNPHICPKHYGSTLWRLPIPDWTIRLDPKLRKDGTIKPMSVQFFRTNAFYNKVNGTFCTCASETVRVLRDVFGRKNYLNYSSTIIPLVEIDCHRMTRFKESLAGQLSWDGSGWSTSNVFKEDPPGLPLGCCRFHTRTVKNCFIHYAPVFLKSPPVTLESTGAEFPSTCAYEQGACVTRSGQFALWTPHKGDAWCYVPYPEEPVHGYQFVPKSRNGTALNEIIWVAGDGSRFLTYDSMGDEFAAEFMAVKHVDCKNGKEIKDGSLLYLSGASYFKLRGCPSSCSSSTEQTIPWHVFKYLLKKARLGMKHALTTTGEALRLEPTSTLQAATQMWNLTAYVINNLLRIRPCFNLPIGSYELLETDTKGESSPRILVRFIAQRKWYFGYLNLETQEVLPSFGFENRDEKRRLIDTWKEQFEVGRSSRIIYPVDPFSQRPVSWIPLPDGPIPSVAIVGWPRMIDSSYTLLNNPENTKEAMDFLAQVLPLDDLYPLGSQHVVLLILATYLIILMLCLHCCPGYAWIKYVNPPYFVARKISQKVRKCSKRRFGSPRVRRKMEEGQNLVETTLSDSSRKKSRSTLWIQDPKGSGKLVKVYQISSVGRLSATVKVQLNHTEHRALLDTGSEITLVAENEAKQLGLEVEPNTESIHGVTVAGDVFPLMGRTKVDLQIGNRLMKNHEFFVAEKPPCEVLLGLDLLEKLGPFLLDFKNRTLHLYTRKPRASAHVLPLGDDWREWSVAATESVIIPGRSQCLVAAKCAAPAEKDFVFEPSEKIPEFKDVHVAAALVRNKEHQVPVVFLNANNFPVVIYKGTRLGKVQPWKENEPRTSCIQKACGSSRKTKGKSVYMVAAGTAPDPFDGLDLTKSALTEKQKVQLTQFLQEYRQLFAVDHTDLGCLKAVEHQIDTGDAHPINQRPHRTPFAQRNVVEEEIKKMSEAGVIRPSNSPWGSPIVLVPKSDNSVRFCVDFRKLNSVTRKDTFPLPVIAEVLDSVGKAKFFTSMDLMAGYWQIPVATKDIEKTAINTHHGKWEFVRMPFGLCNGTATFQRAMQMVLVGLEQEGTRIYVDDCLVISETFEDHLDKLRKVFDRFTQYGIKLKLKKCHFAMSEIKFLGHVIGRDGLKPDHDKVRAVNEYPKPTSLTELRRFLGMVGYYRRFIPRFAQLARPLYRLMKKDEKFCMGSEEEEESFRLLKSKLVIAPVLSYFDERKQIVLETDASGYGLAAVLSQEENGKLKPLAYASRVMNQAERNYSAAEQECLAVVWGLKQFHCYVAGRSCLVYSDCKALSWLMGIRDPTGRLCRWSLGLQHFNLEIRHRSGASNRVADALSRAPLVAAANVEVDFDSFKKMQREDKQLKPIIESLEALERMTNDEKKEVVSGPEKSFALDINGILVLNKPWKGRYRWVVPQSMRTRLIEQYHDELGHFGVSKVQKAINKKYYWMGSNKEIQDHIRVCISCQKRKGRLPKPKPPLKSIEIPGPFHTFAADIMELPLTLDGNKYVLVFVDMFTKWPEAVAMPNQTARTVANHFLEMIVYRFGSPIRILTDRAPGNFRAALFEEMLRIANCKHILTSGYTPSTNGMVERMNRTLQDLLSHYVDRFQNTWDQYLSAALFAARVMPQESTKESPFYLLHGSDPLLPKEAAFGYSGSLYLDPDDLSYTEQLQWRLSTAWRYAKDSIAIAQQRQAFYYDRDAVPVRYEVGDQVLVNRPETIQGRAAKLGQPWTGPYEITEVLDLQNVKVIPVSDPNVMPVRVHCRRIKPFVREQLANSNLGETLSDEEDGDDTLTREAEWPDEPMEPVLPPSQAVQPSVADQDASGHRYFLRSKRQ